MTDNNDELNIRWKFWSFKNDKTKSYDENIKPISLVGSIQEFWR
jgi:hypothetical protein